MISDLRAPADVDMRGAEVRDHRNRLIRTNHVVFTEGAGDVNQTVSRKHAHIAYKPLTGHFRLHDDGSEHGTEIVRGGRTIPVLRGRAAFDFNRTMKLYSVRPRADQVVESVRRSRTSARRERPKTAVKLFRVEALRYAA